MSKFISGCLFLFVAMFASPAVATLNIEWEFDVPAGRTAEAFILHQDEVVIAKITDWTITDDVYSADIGGIGLKAIGLYTLITVFSDGTESPASITYSPYQDSGNSSFWSRVLILFLGNSHARLDGNRPAILFSE